MTVLPHLVVIPAQARATSFCNGSSPEGGRS